MGSGEYVVDANRRLATKQHKEKISEYPANDSLSAGPVVPGRNDFRSSVSSADYISPAIRHFQKFGIGRPALQNASRIAVTTGRSAGEELIRSGAISRSGFAQITARVLGVEYSPTGPDPELLTRHTRKLSATNKTPLPASPAADFSDIATEYRGWREKPKIYVACEPEAIDAITKLTGNNTLDHSQISLTTRKVLHYSQYMAKRDMHLADSIGGLSKNHPDISASRIITIRQVVAIVASIFVMVLLLSFSPALSMLAIHLVASTFYLFVTIMRAAMIIPGVQLIEEAPIPVSKSRVGDRELPIYTVMVALYKEAGQIDELVDALCAIDWPADRLQILLICEQDDPDTIEKCRSRSDDERIQTIICPVAQPRTKPKALNFALPLAKGEFLVLYDAEDRPHPDQLREAHAKFRRQNEFACLQAPLLIHNDHQSWFTRLFAIEYTTLFCLILPVLEHWNAPIPLGGTSNHFRTSVLQKIGAWDPYNVTEDADLGIRLARFGYRCGTIRLPTMEEAPPVFDVWFKQRTRWIKGWIQTFLVHMRHPIKLTRELGLRKMLLMQLVVTAIVLSVLIHPFFIASTIYYGFMLSRGMGWDGVTALILGIDVFNLVGGYTTYIAIVLVTLDVKNRQYLRRWVIWVPLYWLLISAAGWRALFQLFHKPFLWEKTRHGLVSKK